MKGDSDAEDVANGGRAAGKRLGASNLRARDLSPASDERGLDRRIVITALGIAQILAWVTSFYFPAVFAAPIVRDTGWSLGFVVGVTSL